MVRYRFQGKFCENGADEKPMTNFWQRNGNAIPNCKICAVECMCMHTHSPCFGQHNTWFYGFLYGFSLGFFCLMFLLVTVCTVVAKKTKVSCFGQAFFPWLLRSKYQLGFLGVVYI
jgi:hypothetical protein